MAWGGEMRRYGCVSFFALVLIGTSASAQDAGRYGQLNLGSSISGDTQFSDNGSSSKYDFTPGSGLFSSLLIGQRFGDGWALEAEAVYAQTPVRLGGLTKQVVAPVQPPNYGGLLYTVSVQAKSSTDAYAGLVNLVYNFRGLDRITPYVGAGVGYGKVSGQLYGWTGHSDDLLWQIKAGVTLPLAQRVRLDLGYRYLDTPTYRSSGIANPGGDVLYGLQCKAQSVLHVLSVGGRLAF